jgi:UDP-N-acetylglucosamine kinase
MIIWRVMNTDDEILERESIEYVKKHHKELIEMFVGRVRKTTKPISIFMAGSPGAGKTEFSTRLVDEIMGAKDKIVRIDPDEVRMWLPQYTQGKAQLFQGAVSVGVSKIHDYVKSNSYSFLLDDTFSNVERAKENVRLSLDKGRPVFIQ